MKNLLLIAVLVACAGSKEETKPPAETTPPAAAPGSAQQGAQPGAQPGQIGQPPAKPPESSVTGTQPQTAATQAAQPARPEPPLMPDEEFRGKKPSALPVQPRFAAPVPIEKKLKSGARVLIVENHQLPLVAIDVRFLHGIDTDPEGKAGLAEFVADMADEGTKTRPATKLAEEIEDLAAHLGASASLQNAGAHLNCLSETLPKALELLADVVQNPAFRKEDVERVRLLKLTQLQQKKSSIGALASDEAARILYGDKHPWGQPAGGTPESITAITTDDLAKHHATWWVPNDAIISVSGDVKPDEIVKLLEKAFGGWKSKPLPKLKLPAVPKLEARSIDAVEKANATQSQVWVVGHLFPARDPDAIPLRVANMTLGGLFGSRLNMNLREKHGYSYGVRSALNLMRDTGTFIAYGGIVAKNTVDAVSEYEAELAKFTSGEVTDEELLAARTAYIRSIPTVLETNDAVSGAMGGLVSLGLPLDYYRTLPARIEKVDRAEVARVAKKWVTPAKWPVILVGPVGQSKDALEKLGFGPVTLQPAEKPSASK